VAQSYERGRFGGAAALPGSPGFQRVWR